MEKQLYLIMGVNILLLISSYWPIKKKTGSTTSLQSTTVTNLSASGTVSCNTINYPTTTGSTMNIGYNGIGVNTINIGGIIDNIYIGGYAYHPYNPSAYWNQLPY